MDRDVFVHPEVIARARDHFVTVKLQSDLHEAIALRYGLSGLPSTIIIAPSGAVIARQEGYVSPDSFRTFLDQALARSGRSRHLASHPAREPRQSPPDAAPAVRTDDKDQIALAGYCPVTLVKGKRLEEGQAALSLRYDGREYRFASDSVRDAFLKDPESFLPANGGRCVVSDVDRHEKAEGDPRFAVLYRNRLYLCADEASRSRFLKDPERYWNADVADKGFCPHCRNQKGLLVRGSPRYTVTHAGRLYFFPDAVHLAAFRETPDKYVR
jgi:YHS domain-containing protein